MSRFNRTHYEVVAKVLKEAKPTLPATPILVGYWRDLVEEFAAYFEITQVGFNKKWFLEACKYEVAESIDVVVERGYF